MEYKEILTVSQVMNRFLPEIKSKKHDPTKILAGIFYVLITGIQWRNLIKEYPPKSTCYYWFRKLSKMGAWKDTYQILFEIYAKHFNENLNTFVVDGTFVKAAMGGSKIGNTKIGKGTKVMQMVDKEGLLVSLHIDSANPHESQLLIKTLKNSISHTMPKYILGDRAYDSDKLDMKCKKMGVTLVAYHKLNRKNITQDGQEARRLKKRYIVERTNAHLKNYRKVNVRYERKPKLFEDFIWMAHCLIFIKKFNIHNDYLVA